MKNLFLILLFSVFFIFSTGHQGCEGCEQPNNYADWVSAFVSATTGKDDPANGTKENPYKTIQYAIDRANAGDYIAVAAGTYEGPIILKEGVSIHGSYDSEDWHHHSYDRLNSKFQTKIIGTSGDYIVLADGISSSTEMTGFYITWKDNIGSNPVLIKNSSLIFERNTVYSGSSECTANYAIKCINSNPRIDDCDIMGNEGYTSGGIYNNNSNPKIIYCNINGGYGKTSIGIHNDNNSNPNILSNKINGGMGTNTIGILNNNSSGEIFRNTIIGGVGESIGILNTGSASKPEIYANFIDGGDNFNSCAIQEKTLASGKIYNNVITGGTGTTTKGIFLEGSDVTKIYNNTIICKLGTIKNYGIHTNSNSIITNNIIDVANNTKYGVQISGGTPQVSYNDIYVVGTDSGTNFIGTNNNINVNPLLDVGHKPTNMIVVTSGTDLSSEGITKDKNWKVRTVPYSMGAYEIN